MIARALLALLLVLTPAPALAAACPAPLRVMSYNVRLDTPADGDNRWDRRRPLLVSQLDLLQPAILGLQEVLPGQLRDLEAALPGHVRIGEGRDGAGQGEAAPLFIDRRQFKVRASGTFWLSPTPQVPSLGWDAAYRRVASWARVQRRTDGARLLAINTHWDHVGMQARQESARQLAAWIAAHRAAGERVVLLADFNAALDEASLGHLLGTLRDARQAAGAQAAGTTITFNGFDPLPRAGETIDHILASPDLPVVRYHALAEQFDGRVASDHFPVIADLALRAGSASRMTGRTGKEALPACQF